MKRDRTSGLLLVSLVLVLSALVQEKKIKRADLPAAVEKTVVEQSKGATIRGFSQEKEKTGQTTYEAEMILNGHTKDVQMDANGGVTEIEEQLDLQAVPAAARAGLE